MGTTHREVTDVETTHSEQPEQAEKETSKDTSKEKETEKRGGAAETGSTAARTEHAQKENKHAQNNVGQRPKCRQRTIVNDAT